MDPNKIKDDKRPGEKKPGKFHYNPGNMSGKSIQDPCHHGTGTKEPDGEARERDKGRKG